MQNCTNCGKPWEKHRWRSVPKREIPDGAWLDSGQCCMLLCWGGGNYAPDSKEVKQSVFEDFIPKGGKSVVPRKMKQEWWKRQ